MSDVREARSPMSFAITGAAVGAVGCIVGAIVDPRRAAAAYLAAWMAVLTTVLGALCTIMIAHLTGATWFVVLRRRAEQVAATLPLLAVLFVPVALAVRVLYRWTAPGALADPAAIARVAAKHAYLNVPFFLARAVLYLAIWVVLAELLRRWSLEQDVTADPALARRQRVASAIGCIAVGLTLTFASFDWLMSLTPVWYSTIYGVYVFGGAMVGALALITVLAWRGRAPDGALPVRDDHLHALGKLQLTFVLFWAYIGYAQLIVIWSGDLPAEVTWYVARVGGGWRAVDALLVAGHFAIPFVALLLWGVKRSARAMGVLALWLLAMHYVDVYWLVLPSVTPSVLRPDWMDLAALLLVAGAAIAFGLWRARGEAAYPARDPELELSVTYTTG